MRNYILIFLTDVNNVSKRREAKNKRNKERYQAKKLKNLTVDERPRA